MNKDVIYIDVEDDITAIINKVKESSQRIVAVVPPKRIGVLQSAVNLQLLARAAKNVDKRLVIISNNAALCSLAGMAKIPVAKNLQSKPAIAEISAIDVDGEDIIDGSSLPVGDFAKMSSNSSNEDKAFNEVVGNDKSERNSQDIAKENDSRRQLKVPNFNVFRKKLIFFVVGGILLIGGLAWGIFFAPKATIVISARTTESSANVNVTLAGDNTTDFSSGKIKTLVQEKQEELTTEFKATGKKEIGEKATGKMTITRTSISPTTSLDVPVGTSFSSDQITFVSTEAAVLAPTSLGEGEVVHDSATISVEAAKVGDEYNLSARQYNSNVGGFKAEGTDMSGGSSREVTVVTKEDVETAADKIAKQDTDEIKATLLNKFDETYIAIDQTFINDRGYLRPSPAIGKEADQAELKVTVTYKISGVAKSEMEQFLSGYFENQTSKIPDRRVYDNGLNNLSFTNITRSENAFKGNVVATAKIGPKINDDEIKEAAKGKRYGDIQSSLEAIQGVDSVDVKFWPFWVSSAPKDTKKINIEFNLNESK